MLVAEMRRSDWVYIQPINISDYQQFRFYAKRAELVTFETQYHDIPFSEARAIEPAQYLKALKIWAFGVIIEQLPFTLTHTIEFPWIPFDGGNWEARVSITGLRLSILTEELETDLQAVQSTPSSPSIRELLVKTLR